MGQGICLADASLLTDSVSVCVREREGGEGVGGCERLSANVCVCSYFVPASLRMCRNMWMFLWASQMCMHTVCGVCVWVRPYSLLCVCVYKCPSFVCIILVYMAVCLPIFVSWTRLHPQVWLWVCLFLCRNTQSVYACTIFVCMCALACVWVLISPANCSWRGLFPPAIWEPSNFLLSNSPARLNLSGGLGSLRNVNWKQWPWMLSCYYLTWTDSFIRL